MCLFFFFFFSSNKRKRDCKAHDTRVTLLPLSTHTQASTITFSSPFFVPSHLFFPLFDTHTVSWLLRVCIDVVFFFFFSRFSNARIHISKSSFVFFALFSLFLSLAPHCLLASSRVFFLVCVRGPVCTFFVFFFFFFLYNANIMSAARPIDSRQLHALRS